MAGDGKVRAGVLGTGSHVPDRIVDNRELAERYGCSEEWILKRTGIQERRFAEPGVAASDLGLLAARRALDAAAVEPKELDLVICATYTPDMAFPSTACLIQDRLGAQPAASFDLQAACSGFVYALVTAAQFIATGSARRVLVVGSDVNSRIIDPNDQKVTALFGDGAGAVVLGPVNGSTGLLGWHMGADGSGGSLFRLPAGGSRKPASADTVEAREHFIQMDGPTLFRFAVEALVTASRRALDRSGLTPESVDLFVPHQANLRILEAGIERLKIPRERMLVTVDRYANTAAATIPIALDEAVRTGRVSSGANLLMTGFGAGLTWGAAVLRWTGGNGNGDVTVR